VKVEIDTYNRKVTMTANDSATSPATVDKWIKALRVARDWLRKEIASSKGPS
jgi:hypothetical protein